MEDWKLISAVIRPYSQHTRYAENDVCALVWHGLRTADITNQMLWLIKLGPNVKSHFGRD